MHFQRQSIIGQRPPPARETGVIGWVRANLLSDPWNAALTLAGLYLLALILIPVIKFTVINAVWNGNDRTACLAADTGACWAFVKAKFGQFIYGRYPDAERWRVDLVFAMGLIGLIPMLIPKVPFKKWNAVYLLAVFPIAAFGLLTGPLFGLPSVETSLWGGLLVTLVVAVTGITFSLPLGILLALGRRSELPVIKWLSITFIEFWRGVPLITVLFMASVMLPLFLPEGVTFDKLLRALIGVALFASAYMAEVVRGGLQAIPRGQYEGAQALGLSYAKTMGLVVLPQALKHVIPGIVNTFIGLFKDTTLVLIIGLFDLLGIVQLGLTDASWSAPTTHITGYVFAGFIFWVFCFAMSRYSMFIERRLETGRAGHG